MAPLTHKHQLLALLLLLRDGAKDSGVSLRREECERFVKALWMETNVHGFDGKEENDE